MNENEKPLLLTRQEACDILNLLSVSLNYIRTSGQYKESPHFYREAETLKLKILNWVSKEFK